MGADPGRPGSPAAAVRTLGPAPVAAANYSPPPPAAQGGTGGPPVLPPGGLPSSPPAAQGGTGGPPNLAAASNPAVSQAAAQRQQILSSLIHQASSWGASNGIPFALQAQVLAGAAAKYQIPLKSLLGIYGQETSFGQNVTYSGVGPGQGATGPFQFEPFNFGKYGYPGTNKPTPSQFAQQVDAFGKYLVANNGSKNPSGWAPAMGGGYSQAQAESTLSNIPHGLAAAVASVTGGKIPAVDPAKAAAALRSAAADAPPAVVPGTLGGLQSTATAGQQKKQWYVNPIPGFTLGRTDMGVDANAPVGTPIRAIGDSKLTSVHPFYQGQPLYEFQFTNGPRAGQYWYASEQIASNLKPGDTVKAGQPVGTYAPSGTGLEIGFGGDAAGNTLAQTTTGYTEGQQTQAGLQFRALLDQLAKNPAAASSGLGSLPSPSSTSSGAASTGTSSTNSTSSTGLTGSPAGGASVGGGNAGAQAQAAQTQQQALLAQLMGQGQQSTLQSLLASNPGNLWNTIPGGGGADAFAGLGGGGDMSSLLGLAHASLQSLVPNLKLRGLGAVSLP